MIYTRGAMRARIGTFNNKCCSDCSLSSLSSLSLASSHCYRHRGSTGVSQKEPSSIEHTSPCSSSLATKEQSQAFPSTDGHPVLTTSSTLVSRARPVRSSVRVGPARLLLPRNLIATPSPPPLAKEPGDEATPPPARPRLSLPHNPVLPSFPLHY